MGTQISSILKVTLKSFKVPMYIYGSLLSVGFIIASVIAFNIRRLRASHTSRMIMSSAGREVNHGGDVDDHGSNCTNATVKQTSIIAIPEMTITRSSPLTVITI